MSENIFDVLGVLTAFITVMLIFSIAITSLVQATQGLFRWRARNLQNSLAKILKSVQHDDSDDDAGKNAIALLNKSDAALVNSRLPATGVLSRIFGPQLSWMTPEELDRELRKQKDIGLDDAQATEVSEKFRRSQGAMSKVFLRRMRMATIFWAFVFAIYYQLSAPALLEDFSTDPDRRDAVSAQGERMLAAVTEEGAPEPVDANEIDTVVETVAAEETVTAEETVAAEETTGAIDPATGANAALNAVPPQALSETNDEAETVPGDSDKGTTPYFELTPWRGEWEFYYAAAGEAGTYRRSWYQRIEWNNVVGVLLTVLLLSLGAPFWFDMLKQVVNLKDTLERSTGREGEQDSEQTETEPTPSVTNDRINLLKERMLAAKSPVVKATLQKEINDLRLIRAEQA